MDHVRDSLDPPPSYRNVPASDDARRKFPVIRRRRDGEVALVAIQVRAGLLSVRDAMPSDVHDYVRYWHCGGEEIKNLLGIDPNKLGTAEDSHNRFFQMIRIPGTDQADVLFTITLNGKVIGYTNINRLGPDDNYVHLHTYRASLRSALKSERPNNSVEAGLSVAGALIGLVGGYFDLFPIDRITLPTRPQNRWINSALDLYMPPTETKYVEASIGLAAPGELHLRYVRREDVPWIVARMELLRNVKNVRTAANRPDRLSPSAREAQPSLGPSAVAPREVILRER